jgi:signal recognition particle GTPase
MITIKINKDQFTKAMSQIQNLHSQQDTLNKLIDKLTDGFSVVDIGNYVAEELIDMININLELEDTNLLDWWLYEDVEKIIYIDDKPIKVETLDELWDYIQNYN